MRITPEFDRIDSKRMRVDAMNKKRKLIFAEECRGLLELHDKVGTKGNKNHAKREAKVHLKHKYY